ncbi:5,6-dimethylbenzimidazole synthase [Sphingobium sufflavum]|nr:5,6-dimethylbenzimidazole synthase [Sphingobium sufflavum]
MRRFRRDPLPDGALEELLQLAQQAPSVGNSQPWRFVRVRSDHLRTDLANHVDVQVISAGERIADATKRAAYAALKLHGLREAPEIVAVFCDEETQAGTGLGATTMPEARRYSVVLAIHTLWLAARARGMALGWVSIVDPAHVKALLAVPDGWRLVALLCIGWPEANSSVPELERLGWQKRIDWRQNVSER